MNTQHSELMQDLNLKLEKEQKNHQQELIQLTSEMRDYKFKYEDIKEQFQIMKNGEQMINQDIEHATSQYISMRDKFLRL